MQIRGGGNGPKGPRIPPGNANNLRFTSLKAKASWMTSNMRIESHTARHELQSIIIQALGREAEMQSFLGTIMEVIEERADLQDRFDLSFILMTEIMSAFTEMLNQKAGITAWQLIITPLYVEDNDIAICFKQDRSKGETTSYIEKNGTPQLDSTKRSKGASDNIMEYVGHLLKPENARAVYYHEVEGAKLEGVHFEVFPAGVTYEAFRKELKSEQTSWHRELDDQLVDNLIKIDRFLLAAANRTPSLGDRHWCWINLLFPKVPEDIQK